MIRVIFYNPESQKHEAGTIRDYHETRLYAELRGAKPEEFKVIEQKRCATKKAAKEFENRVKLYN